VTLLSLSPSLINAAELTLAWDANSEEDLAGYKLHYGTQSGNYSVTIDVQNVTQYTIGNLEEYQDYYFVATAYDTDANESEYSEEVYYDAEDPPPEPLPIPACCADLIISQIDAPSEVTYPITGPTIISIYTSEGNYTAKGSVHASSGGNNSFFIDIDSDPAGDQTRGWHLDVNTDYETQVVRWGTYSEPNLYQNPVVWSLSEGNHLLYLRVRESGSRIESLTVSKE